jgi:hypothetical protein
MGVGGAIVFAAAAALLSQRFMGPDRAVAFAAFGTTVAAGRGQRALAGRCAHRRARRFGGHAIWWDVNAASEAEAEALDLLPAYIAQRTAVVAIATVKIP